MQKSTRDADRSRAAIVDAAEDLFSRLGFERVSLADIAKLAGVSRGLPSYFYVDKETLYNTVMEQAATDNRRTVLDAVRATKGNPARQVFLTLIDRYIDYLAAHPRVVRLLQWEALEARNEDSSGAPARVFVEASNLVSACIGAKQINKIDIPDLLLSTVSMCLYAFQVRPIERAQLKSFAQRHKRHVSRMVLRAIGEGE